MRDKGKGSGQNPGYNEVKLTVQSPKGNNKKSVIKFYVKSRGVIY